MVREYMLIANKFLLSSVVLLALTPIGFSQNERERYVDSDAGFSFSAPEGWNIFPVSDDKYKVISNPKRVGEVAQIITADDDNCLCSLAEYLNLAQGRLDAKYRKFGPNTRIQKILRKEEFITLSGLKGWKLTESMALGKFSPIFRQYIFERRGNSQLILTCGGSDDPGASLESVCDSSIKTLTLSK